MSGPNTDKRVPLIESLAQRSCRSAKYFTLALLAYAALFTTGFIANLHCTQYTSFYMATFEMEPHIEEAEGSYGTPMVFKPGYAIPIRIGLSLSLLAFLFLPPSLGLFLLDSRIRYGTWLVASLLAVGALLVSAFLPIEIIGERYRALLWYALYLGALPMVILGGVLWISCRRC